MQINLSIVIPIFNEEKNIYPLYDEIENLKVENFKTEIILVNNGSTDSSGQKIKEIISLHNKKLKKNILIRDIYLPKNLNYDGGIYKGLSVANGNFISWTHGDLQTPIMDVINFYNLVKNEQNFFGKGYRVNDRGFDFFITACHSFLASKILSYKMTDINAQPKIFKKEDLIFFNDPPKSYTRLDTYFYYISLKKGFKIYENKVIFKNRIYGSSKWKNNLITLFKHLFFNTIYLIHLKIKSQINKKNF